MNRERHLPTSEHAQSEPVSFVHVERLHRVVEHALATPKTVTAPPTLLIQTRDFGRYESYLNPEIEHQAHPESFELNGPIPTEITDFCQYLAGLGARGLLVGGSVRDSLYGAVNGTTPPPIKDFDLEVYGVSPFMLKRILAKFFGEANLNQVGQSFGIIKVSIPGWPEPLDVSIPRSDSKVAAGHTGFAIKGDPSMSILEGSRRRDLKVNSVAFDPLSRTLYDPFFGKMDLENRSISVTDPEKFVEDPLRVYRIMQFAARLELAPTPETIELCRVMVETGMLDDLSRERVTEEFEKLLLKSPQPSEGLRFAREVGIVERYWPELHALIGVQQHQKWHPEGDVWEHTLQTVDAAADIARREELSKEDSLVLISTLLGHDYGKPLTTFQDDKGIWRAPGHENKGVAPARDFFSRFTLPEAVVEKILVLIADHMSPKAYYLNEHPYPEPPRQPKDMSGALNNLAVRLAKGKATTEMLSWVAEADQRGRNGESSHHLARTEVPELEEWQAWYQEKTRRLQIDRQAPTRIFQGQDLLNLVGLENGGVWTGVITNLVYKAQLEGLITDLETAQQESLVWLERFLKYIEIEMNQPSPMSNLTWAERIKQTLHHPKWRHWKHLEDPRTALDF